MNQQLEAARARRPYTVILQYSGEYHQDSRIQTYMAHVTAPSVDAAIAKAQAACRGENDWTTDHCPDSNLPALAVFIGHQFDLLPY